MDSFNQNWSLQLQEIDHLLYIFYTPCPLYIAVPIKQNIENLQTITNIAHYKY